MTVSEYEKQVQALIGYTLAEVVYVEIDYLNEAAGESSNKPNWNWDSRFDSLDFGLELRTEEGDSFWISWGSEFFQYDIEVTRNTKVDSSTMRKWNVSGNGRWSALVGKKIREVQIYWSWVEECGQRVEYPQDLRITFESGKAVYVSAFEIRDFGGSYHGFADHITVFFDEAIASQYGIGPFAAA